MPLPELRTPSLSIAARPLLVEGWAKPRDSALLPKEEPVAVDLSQEAEVRPEEAPVDQDGTQSQVAHACAKNVSGLCHRCCRLSCGHTA